MKTYTEEDVERVAEALYDHDNNEERRHRRSLGLPFMPDIPIMPWDAQAGPSMDAKREQYRSRARVALDVMKPDRIFHDDGTVTEGDKVVGIYAKEQIK